MVNKRGTSLVNLPAFLAFALIFIIMLGSFVYVYGVVDTALTGGNIIAGAVNLSNSSGATIGKLNTAFLNSADLIGVMFLFGMILAMLFAGYLTRDEVPTVFFLVDFFLIVLSYILATYLSNTYDTILVSLPFANIFVNNLSKSSIFLTSLPLITVVVGVLVMIITYAGIPKTRQEEVAGI